MKLFNKGYKPPKFKSSLMVSSKTIMAKNMGLARAKFMRMYKPPGFKGIKAMTVVIPGRKYKVFFYKLKR